MGSCSGGCFISELSPQNHLACVEEDEDEDSGKVIVVFIGCWVVR